MAESSKGPVAKELRATVFTIMDCPFCERAKAILTELGVHYQERDVEMLQHNKALRELTGGIVTPTVVIGKAVLIRPGEEKLRATIHNERCA